MQMYVFYLPDAVDAESTWDPLDSEFSPNSCGVSLIANENNNHRLLFEYSHSIYFTFSFSLIFSCNACVLFT